MVQVHEGVLDSLGSSNLQATLAPPSPCPRENPDEDGDIQNTRSRRKRKARDIGDLSQCLCGETVSPAQIHTGTEIAQCKTAGCETKWVSTFSNRNWTKTIQYHLTYLQYHLACIGMEQVPKTWTCTSCISSGMGRAGKYRRY
jgi:hypothetical protein